MLTISMSARAHSNFLFGVYKQRWWTVKFVAEIVSLCIGSSTESVRRPPPSPMRAQIERGNYLNLNRTITMLHLY